MQFSSEFRIGPGTIIGRQLAGGEITSKQAEQIATEITQQLASSAGSALAASPRFEPAVLISEGGTTCGMICSDPLELKQ